MKTRTKPKSSLLLSVVLIAVMLIAFAVNAYAAQSNAVSQDGLTVQMFTDKNSYKANEQIAVTVRVDNQSGREVSIWTTVNVPKSVKLVGSASQEAFLQDGGTFITPTAGTATTGSAAIGGAVATGDNMSWLWIVLAVFKLAELQHCWYMEKIINKCFLYCFV